MRLPWSKVYRAFPELDEFDDDQCERFVRWAWSKVWLRMVVLPVAGGIAWVVAVHLVLSILPATLPGLPPGIGGANLVALLIVVLSLASSVAVGFFIRDSLLIRAIRDRVRSARCLECRFSLLGLPICEGAVAYPECGTALALDELGLTARDLMVEED